MKRPNIRKTLKSYSTSMPTVSLPKMPELPEMPEMPEVPNSEPERRIRPKANRSVRDPPTGVPTNLRGPVLIYYRKKVLANGMVTNAIGNDNNCTKRNVNDRYRGESRYPNPLLNLQIFTGDYGKLIETTWAKEPLHLEVVQDHGLKIEFEAHIEKATYVMGADLQNLTLRVTDK